MEENVRVCDICGAELEEGEGIWVGEKLLCEDHIEEHCTTCDHCGGTIWVSDVVQDNDTTLCGICFNDYYHCCECSDRIIHDNNVNWRGDYPYCDNCYDTFNDEIEEYGYKPEPVFYGNGKHYLGVELEVDCGGKDDENARTPKDIANMHNENIYIKSDKVLMMVLKSFLIR